MDPITRFPSTVQFLTPACLGDAEQRGRWRMVAGSMTKTNKSKGLLP